MTKKPSLRERLVESQQSVEFQKDIIQRLFATIGLAVEQRDTHMPLEDREQANMDLYKSTLELDDDRTRDAIRMVNNWRQRHTDWQEVVTRVHGGTDGR